MPHVLFIKKKNALPLGVAIILERLATSQVTSAFSFIGIYVRYNTNVWRAF